MSMETQSGGQTPEANGFPIAAQVPIGSSEFPEITEEASVSDLVRNEPPSFYTGAGEITPIDESVATAELATQKLQEALQDLGRTVNWNKVVDAYLADTEGMDADQLASLIAACGPAAQAVRSGEIEQHAITDIETIRETLTAQGYALPLEDQQEVSISTKSDLDYPSSDWARKWSQASRYMDGGHAHALYDLESSQVIRKIHPAYRRLFNIPPHIALIRALNERAAESAAEFKLQEQALLDEADPTPPEIHGLSLLERCIGVGKEENIRNFLKGRHPEAFRRGLKDISFVESISGDDPTTTGVQRDGSIKIKVVPGAKVTDLHETLDHELIHYAHGNRMSIEMLSEWDDIVQAEEVAVTAYVEKSYEESDQCHPGSEDMAESGALYLNKPIRLLATAPQRFAWFQKHYHILPDEYVAKLHEHLAKRAKTQGKK